MASHDIPYDDADYHPEVDGMPGPNISFSTPEAEASAISIALAAASRRENADQAPVADRLIATRAGLRMVVPGDRKRRIRQGV
jgi:hypothetical protein